MNDAKEEIKARLAVEDVVGQYVELSRAGKTLKGRSPWGVDRTPSLMVSPDKGIWHDFSANKGGDIFTFVMEVEGITFREALEKLAAQAGVILEKYSGGDGKVTRLKKRAREALEMTCKFYQICLTKNREVCEYVFYTRNMNRKTVQNFRIGYAPRTKNALLNFLFKKGFDREEIGAAGLLNRFGGDIFVGRMMVPFIDVSGVIGFTARILDKGEPKYLNTPETLLFNKSGFIFGLVQARDAIRRSGFCVVVEGNMDVISSHQAGVCEAVATSGTAMTEQHLKKLSRLTEDVRLAYDADAAGVKAAERAIMMAGNLGIKLSVVTDYHGAKDPDELIQKDPELWRKAVEGSVPAMEWLLGKYEERVDLSTGVGKREYSDVAIRMIKFIQDPVERKHYERIVADKLAVTIDDLEAKKVKEGKKILKTVKTELNEDNLALMVGKIENGILAIVLFGGESAGEIEVEMPATEEKMAEIAMIFEEEYKDWKNDDLKRELKNLIERRNEILKRIEREKLMEELGRAEGEEEIEKILAKINGLK